MSVNSSKLPPRKKRACPLTRDKLTESDTAPHHAQVMESAHLTLPKSWIRFGNQSRMEFLRDVKAAHPAMWRVVSEEDGQ